MRQDLHNAIRLFLMAFNSIMLAAHILTIIYSATSRKYMQEMKIGFYILT